MSPIFLLLFKKYLFALHPCYDCQLEEINIILGDKSSNVITRMDLLRSSQLLQYVERHQTALSRLPKLEQRLSSLLNNISIARSTHEPVVMATEYQQQLTKMIATVEKYRATNPSSVVSGSLQGLQLVVEWWVSDSSLVLLSQKPIFCTIKLSM